MITQFKLTNRMYGFVIDTTKISFDDKAYYETAVWRGDDDKAPMCIAERTDNAVDAIEMHSFWCEVCEWKYRHEKAPYSMVDIWGDTVKWES